MVCEKVTRVSSTKKQGARESPENIIMDGLAGLVSVMHGVRMKHDLHQSGGYLTQGNSMRIWNVKQDGQGNTPFNKNSGGDCMGK